MMINIVVARLYVLGTVLQCSIFYCGAMVFLVGRNKYYYRIMIFFLLLWLCCTLAKPNLFNLLCVQCFGIFNIIFFWDDDDEERQHLSENVIFI